MHDMGISVTFQAVAIESQALSDMTLRSNELAHNSSPTIAQSALAKKVAGHLFEAMLRQTYE